MENTREIEREIAEARQGLIRNIDELEARFKAVTDWRWHYRRHMGAALAVGVCSGLILESMTHRRRSSARRVRDVNVGRARLVAMPRKRSRVGRMLEKLVVMGSTKAFNLAADRIVARLRGSRSADRSLRLLKHA